MSTTPTVEIAVTELNAGGGIILTASHNPKQWNALKLLNEKGEFISAVDGQTILTYAERTDTVYADVDELGTYSLNGDMLNKHIDHILNMTLVDVDAVKDAKFKIVVDGVNSTGGIAIPALLEKLGVEVIRLFCEPTGLFPHNPEPLPEHLSEISSVVDRQNAHLGIVVDPDGRPTCFCL